MFGRGHRCPAQLALRYRRRRRRLPDSGKPCACGGYARTPAIPCTVLVCSFCGTVPDRHPQAPYFTGFDGDLGDLRVGIVPFAVPCPSLSDIDSGIRPAVLDAALEAAARQHPSGRVSVLLLTNPHNPTGLLYSESALSDAVEWASSRGLHVLVDEVYSNTVFCMSTGVGKEDKSCRKVTSVLQVR